MKIVGGEEVATNFRNDRYHGTVTLNTETFGDPNRDPNFLIATLPNGRPKLC